MAAGPQAARTQALMSGGGGGGSGGQIQLSHDKSLMAVGAGTSGLIGSSSIGATSREDKLLADNAQMREEIEYYKQYGMWLC